MLFTVLQPGDDVLYHTATSSEPCCGRIISIMDLSYSILKYEYVDDLPLPSQACLSFREVCLTSNTCYILKASVDDLIFVFSCNEIDRQILSKAGMSNVYFVRFHHLQGEIVTLTNWTSLNRRSLPQEIFISLSRVTEGIVKLLSNQRISQRINASLGKISMSPDSFEYIKKRTCHLTDMFSFRERRGFRVERKVSPQMRKETIRAQVTIQELKSIGSDAISILTDLFGSIIRYGARTKHPRAGAGNAVDVYPTTILNVLEAVRFTYVVDYEQMAIQVQYRRTIAQDYDY